ncbi:hypothetical protein [Desulfobulbus elongatus]|uniref:hypothetical protein n=1 Tax=Desulfobulbus elongatus TaxID=53332 RepID=UPI000487F50E|nr:hypothetical protein [Desulfobulbus elongatus]
MSRDILLNTANKYLMDDIENAVHPGGRFAIILEKLETNGKLSTVLLKFLHHRGFHALHRLAAGELAFVDYLPLAREEQDERRAAAEKEACRIKFLAEAEEAERERQDRARHERYEAEQRARMEEQRARMEGPRYQAKIRERELRRQYGLDAFIDPKNYPKLMGLLRNLDKGSRISAEEFLWLSTQDDDTYDCYLTEELAKRYHLIEAKYLAAEFKRTGDPWQAVNASSHFRKCDKPQQAEQLLGKIEISRLKGTKLQSALYTTRGGAKRDLRAFDTALELGHRAHELTPRDFRPCTLLGAVYYEQGNCEQGKTWYGRAVERGFEESQVDNELKSIFRRLDSDKQDAMRGHLLSLDPKRYQWAKK